MTRYTWLVVSWKYRINKKLITVNPILLLGRQNLLSIQSPSNCKFNTNNIKTCVHKRTILVHNNNNISSLGQQLLLSCVVFFSIPHFNTMKSLKQLAFTLAFDVFLCYGCVSKSCKHSGKLPHEGKNVCVGGGGGDNITFQCLFHDTVHFYPNCHILKHRTFLHIFLFHFFCLYTQCLPHHL